MKSNLPICSIMLILPFFLFVVFISLVYSQQLHINNCLLSFKKYFFIDKRHGALSPLRSVYTFRHWARQTRVIADTDRHRLLTSRVPEVSCVRHRQTLSSVSHAAALIGSCCITLVEKSRFVFVLKMFRYFSEENLSIYRLVTKGGRRR